MPMAHSQTHKSSFWESLPRPKVPRGWSGKLAILLAISAVISGLATYAALTETPPFGNDPDTVIWLLNLDLIILLLLVVLIARRIARIWAGRRENIPGSKLHVRLVVIFSVMAAAPAILMAVFSAVFFHYGVQAWFSDRVYTAVSESQAVAESYLEEHKQVIRADALAMANDLEQQVGVWLDNPDKFGRIMDTQSLLRNLSEAMIFNGQKRILARSSLTFTLTFEDVPEYILQQADSGDVVLMTGDEAEGTENRVRALLKLNNFADAYLFVGRQVDPTVIAHLNATRDAASQYAQLQGQTSGLQVAVTMIFVVVALMFLMAAIWLGIVLARQLVTPIGKLIAVSDRVRAGDLSARVEAAGGIEEFNYLATSFDRMTSQIQQQRDDLVAANRQIDNRRHFIETVLSGVSAGVVGLNAQGEATLANASARALFKDSGDVMGMNLPEKIPALAPLIDEAKAKPGKLAQGEIPLWRKDGGRRVLLVRAVVDEALDDGRGAVLTFDDITELQSAQRKAAWADVARRIAHEIKNPLTPIMLSAERLRRKYLKEITSDPETFTQMTETIVRHVGDIGRMVNEFSAFARMPEPVMKDEDLAAQIREMIVLQKEVRRDDGVVIEWAGLDNAAPVRCDSQQLRQALTNLVQNAVDSVQARMEKDSAPGKVRLFLGQTKEGDYLISISDNGMGLPEGEAASRLTEPYITHKAKGTGLGLAIVKKIMEDHKGQLVLGEPEWLDEVPGWQTLGGASVSLIFPAVSPESASIETA